MKRAWPIFFVLVGACYSPSLSGVSYTCDERNPYCPDGLVCTSGRCQEPGVDNVDGGSMSQPDGLMPAAGCRSGVGYTVGTAFACPGAFNNNKMDAIPAASQLCADTYQICNKSAGIDLAQCKTLPGFFAAQVQAHRDSTDNVDPNNITCGGPKGNQLQLFVGCGRTTQNIVFNLSANQMCEAFGQVLDCSKENEWDCNNAPNLDGVTQRNSRDGVLCCKP